METLNTLNVTKQETVGLFWSDHSKHSDTESVDQETYSDESEDDLQSADSDQSMKQNDNKADGHHELPVMESIDAMNSTFVCDISIVSLIFSSKVTRKLFSFFGLT